MESISNLWLATQRRLTQDHNRLFPKSEQNKPPFQSSLFSLSKALGNIQLSSFSLIVRTYAQYSYPWSAELGYLSAFVFSPAANLPWQKSHRSVKGVLIYSLGNTCNTGMLKYPCVVFSVISIYVELEIGAMIGKQRKRGNGNTLYVK